MLSYRQYRSYNFIKIPLALLAMSATLFLSACNNAQEVTDESTLGSNDAAIANDDKIKRNSMDDVAEAKAEATDDQIAIVEAEK